MISVCIATYNGEKYVCEQLESILKQIGNDDEVIISDDGSTDETLNIIKGFIEKEQKTIKLIEGPRKGVIKNLIKNSYIGCCMAFKCEIKEKILPFPDGIEMHDWWIGLVSEMKYKSYFIDEKLIRYRRHGDNVSSLHHHPLKKMLGNRLTFIKELVKL